MSDSDDVRAPVELLSSIAYLESLDSATLQSVAHTAIRRTYQAEQIVFLEGESSSGLCIVQEGWLKAIKIASDGREQILNFLGPGEVFCSISYWR